MVDDRRIGFAQTMPAVAAPTVVRWVINHIRGNGVEFNIAVAGEQVVFSLDHASLEAALPDSATAFVGAVEVLRIPAPERLHHPGDAVDLPGGLPVDERD